VAKKGHILGWREAGGWSYPSAADGTTPGALIGARVVAQGGTQDSRNISRHDRGI
jgi:hypothetical protein